MCRRGFSYIGTVIGCLMICLCALLTLRCAELKRDSVKQSERIKILTLEALNTAEDIYIKLKNGEQIEQTVPNVKKDDSGAYLAEIKTKQGDMEEKHRIVLYKWE